MPRIDRETEPAYYRPAQRRLASLSNEELLVLFQMRAAKAAAKIKPEGFWDNPQILYWGSDVRQAFLDLHEVMLEAQSRYPRSGILEYGNGPFKDLLPLNELEWVTVAMREHGLLPSGLKLKGGGP